jgi:hypothetical protein
MVADRRSILPLLLPVLLATVAAAQKPAPVISAPDLQRSRAVWFVQAENPVGAEVCVAFEPMPLDPASAKLLDAKVPGGKVGDRVPLGAATWATLDSCTDLDFAGVSLKAGHYPLALERGKDGWCLAVLDGKKVRGDRLLPGTLTAAPVVARIAMKQHAVTGGGAGTLAMELKPAEKGGTATLTVTLGGHQFTADAKVGGSNSASPIAQTEARGCSRIAFLPAADGKQAFAVVDHGTPPWKAEYTATAGKLKKGERWRLGQNWWTTLCTDTPLLLGGKKVAAGVYHLALERDASNGFSLVLAAAEDDDKALIDAFAANYAKTALTVPMRAGKPGATVNALQVHFVQQADGPALVVAFGDQQLTAAVAAQ